MVFNINNYKKCQCISLISSNIRFKINLIFFRGRFVFIENPIEVLIVITLYVKFISNDIYN